MAELKTKAVAKAKPKTGRPDKVLGIQELVQIEYLEFKKGNKVILKAGGTDFVGKALAKTLVDSKRAKLV